MAVPGLFVFPASPSKEIPVRYWLLSATLLCVACSERTVPTGNLPQPADFLPSLAPELPPATDNDTLAEDQPRLVFRCEQGRLGAYIVTDAAAADNQPGNDAVEVRLDSAPAC
jgi:hypothetical protein